MNRLPTGKILSERRIRELLRFSFSQVDDLNSSTENLRPASVLVPIFFAGGEWNLLLTRRTEKVNDHKGQVAFPGGAYEPEDISAEFTALREAQEEIGLQMEDVVILGHLPAQITISRYLISPFVGRIPEHYPFILSREEVDRVFSIPFSWLMAPDHSEEKMYPSRDGKSYPVDFFQEYDGEILWGITAKITKILLKKLQLLK